MTTTDKDLISIITATYNRSNVLKYTIQSVIDQTYENWELLIIGDCCTDDTETVVESFRHPRITFVNLEKNIGEQSGPNNYGMSMAKGNCMALLNHDDLWLPHHLGLLHDRINTTQADLVYSLFYPVHAEKDLRLMPLRVNAAHDLVYGSPASTWLFRKELFLRVGPWKSFKEIYDIPSQDWLGRASKVGKIAVVNEVTVIAVQSGARKNSYKDRDYLDNEAYYHKIKSNPERLLKEIYFEQMMLLKSRDRRIFYHLKAIIRNIIISVITKLGFRPGAVLFIFKNRKKGGYVQELRQIRGLTKI
jgi:glycosyltransferase involved in cell wall biosynthesis